MRLNPLLWIAGRFSHDIGIDLGTANTLVWVKGQGIVIDEPSVVAIDRNTKTILAIGVKAKRMVGRTPANIVAVRPLKDGVISDFDVTERMLQYFIRAVHERLGLGFPRPRVVIGMPSGVTEVEKRAIYDATIQAGAREAFMIEEAGSAFPLEREKPVVLRGRDLATGLPKSVEISSVELRDALSGSIGAIVEGVRQTIEITPPELVADLMNQGIALAGGGALLAGLDRRISQETKFPVYVADDPLTCVVRGCAEVLEEAEMLSKIRAQMSTWRGRR
jgi:rod shape-determining protein MreB